MKSKLIRLLSVFGATAILSASVMNTTLAKSYSINSYGVIQDSDSNVVIDADDIRQNYQAITQLQKQLSALENKSLQWSDELQTYVIVTYELDENGDVIYEETTDSTTGETVKTPKVSNTEAIGALGTADPTMVVENRTFSSLYAKTVYKDSDTAKSPGVQQNGTLIDVLTNGWLSSDLSKPYYATSDTEGTGSSTRAKDESVNSSTRTHTLTAIAYTADVEKAGDDGSISLKEYGPTLDTANTTLTVGISESVTLPAGYYSEPVTIGNGVVNILNYGMSEYTEGGYYVGADYNSDDEYDSDNDGSVSFDEYCDASKNSMTDLSVGMGESVALPAGYYSEPVTIGNGVVNRGSLKSVILTSSNNTVTFEAGYYDTFNVSTDITSASGTITYSHHQCSSTIAGDTYEDAYPDARGAQEVTGLTKINGVTVSTTSAGCYTKPYYYYKYTASRQVANGYDDCIVCKGSSVADQCTEGWTQKEGCTPHTVYKTEYYTAYAYGSSLPSGASIVKTYYTKGCGYTNGQIISATIVY